MTYHRKAAAATTGALLSALTLITLSGAFGAPASRAQQTVTTARRIGNVTIGAYGQIVSQESRSEGVWKFSIVGRNNGATPVPITTESYEMSAKRIELQLKRIAVNGRSTYKATSATASGGVRIFVREPILEDGKPVVENGKPQIRTTTVTCDRAVYKATTDPKDRGRIDMTGGVRTVVTGDPAFDGPLVSENQTGVIEFLDKGDMRLTLNQGVIKGTPIEPKPAPKKGTP